MTSDVETIPLTVRFFAAAREATGAQKIEMKFPVGSTLADLVRELYTRHPALQKIEPSLRFAIDEAFASTDTPLTSGAQVAVIPPVGGG